MKESEFIELLNLYLDHEISPADAVRLEAEVQNNPARRRVYQQYCRMQKACTMLAKDFVETPADAAADKDSRKVVAFEQAGRSGSSWGPGFYAVGGLVAAAACFVVVMVKRSGEPSQNVSTGQDMALVDTPSAKARPDAVTKVPAMAALETKVVVSQGVGIAPSPAITRTVTVPAGHRNDLQPVLATGSLSLFGEKGNGVQAAPSDLVAQLDWIQNLKIAPMQQVPVQQLRFESQSTTPSQVPTVVRPADGVVKELVAFKYTNQ